LKVIIKYCYIIHIIKLFFIKFIILCIIVHIYYILSIYLFLYYYMSLSLIYTYIYILIPPPPLYPLLGGGFFLSLYIYLSIYYLPLLFIFFSGEDYPCPLIYISELPPQRLILWGGSMFMYIIVKIYNYISYSDILYYFLISIYLYLYLGHTTLIYILMYILTSIYTIRDYKY
jgi:hypothetical protein